MKKPRNLELLDKSIAAAISAIEIYNKPDFKYREETFSVLMINAWELLLKAKLLKENQNKITVITEYERRQNKDGKPSKMKYIKRNRAGNAMTIGLVRCIDILNADRLLIDDECKANLLLLQEVRDNSIHFINKDLGFSTKIQEIGTACLANYIMLINEWFDYDLSKYDFYLMPLSFFHVTDVIKSFSVENYNRQMQNLLAYLSETEKAHQDNNENASSVTLQIETRIVKKSAEGAIKFHPTSDPSAPRMQIEEEDIFRTKYPADYQKLTIILRKRYIDFKANAKFHRIKKELEQNKRFCRIKYLDPDNPKSQRKKYYSPEIIKEFDKHYTRKKEK